MRAHWLSASLLFLAIASTACQNPQPPASSNAAPAAPPPATPTVPPPTVERIPATPEAIAEARKKLQELADRDRRMKASLSFDDFAATVYREPFEGGKYIVNGDTTIANKKRLQEFYEQNVKPRQTARLTLAVDGGLDALWNPQQKTKLSYCVSSTFGGRHAQVVQQMTNATGEWEKFASVDFTHDASQDATCTASNQAVVFDVRPVNQGEYLARAFFPNEPRPARNVLIDESSFELDPNEKLQLVGILRHELGHALGFRHEHTRPESGACFEDFDWRPLTSYDAFSVMHYPQCNGKGDWSLTLTDFDKHGIACVYGPAAGFTVDPKLVNVLCVTAPATPTAGAPKKESFAGQSVAKGAQKSYGPFAVAAGSQLDVAINGPTATGDPDLYVRFDLPPSVSSHDCRPFLDGPAESCSVMVPAGATRVFVMVRGFEQGTYDLQVTHVPPTPGTGGKP
jgi:hypothetical protein